MRKANKSKLIIGVICFFIGFFTHLFLTKANFSYVAHNEVDRVPVKPDEFDQTHMGDAFEKRFGIDRDKNSDINLETFDLSPKRREDEKYVYYEIPMSKNMGDNKMNVEIQDGYIHIKLDSKDSNSSHSMEQVFSIESDLDDKKAEVINEKDKIIIKVPKKNV